MNVKNFGLTISALLISAGSISRAHAVESFSGKYKANCTNSPQGCACVTNPKSQDAVTFLLHAQPVEGVQNKDATKDGSTWAELKVV